MTLPLEDVRIVAVEQYGAGPWATVQLADLGADVIKIEDPGSGGDVGRYVPPFQEGEDSLFFESFNRNKRSMSLDLRVPEARTVFEDLVRASDAVFSNLRGDQPSRLGLTHAQLERVNPRIVCCSLSGFGLTGPRADQPAYDYIVQGLAGWMMLTGDPETPPTKTGLSLVDLSAGYVAAVALLSGLWRARREGVGCDCDVSLFDTALSELAYVGTWVATKGWASTRRAESAHPSIVPFQNFETADGWIVVACAKQRFWENLCVAIDRPDLRADEDYVDFIARDRHRDALLGILRGIFQERCTEEWLAILGEANVPCSPVNDIQGALSDPQAVARGVSVEVEHPRLGRIVQIASPLRVGSETKAMQRAPFRGEHTLEVLTGVCGYSPERVAEVAATGALGPHRPNGFETTDEEMTAWTRP